MKKTSTVLVALTALAWGALAAVQANACPNISLRYKKPTGAPKMATLRLLVSVPKTHASALDDDSLPVLAVKLPDGFHQVKEAAFPFNRFDVDILLGPEMRSTGEVMGFDDSFGMAFAKAQISAGNVLPTEPGKIVVTVNDHDKPTVTPILERFRDLGYQILATKGTWAHITKSGIDAERVFKVGEGRPDIVDLIVSGEVALLINTPLGKRSQYDDYAMRRAAITYGTPYITTMSATSAACDAILALRSLTRSVCSLQERVERALGATAARG